MNKLFGSLFLLVVLLLPSTGFTQQRVTLEDGSVLTVFMVMPEALSSTQPARLAIVMGGGPGNLSISQDTSRWLGQGFAQRGWAVAVPVSPNNRSFRGADNARKIELLIKTLQQDESIAQGKVLLAGVSNGGMSALEIAKRKPENYLGVVAVPAVVSASTNMSALADFPVYLRIGSADQLGWADNFDATVSKLTEAGVQLDAAILEGAAHMFGMDWQSLAPWLESLINE